MLSIAVVSKLFLNFKLLVLVNLAFKAFLLEFREQWGWLG